MGFPSCLPSNLEGKINEKECGGWLPKYYVTSETLELGIFTPFYEILNFGG